MWISFLRPPRPDAVIWPGRPALAAVDAVVWPALGVAVALGIPGAGGVVRPVLTALMLFTAFSRLRRALWFNHRYRFITPPVLRGPAVLVLIGMFMRLALA